jgi:hypothetical protein
MGLFRVVENVMLGLSLCLMSEIDDLNLYFHLVTNSLKYTSLNYKLK